MLDFDGGRLSSDAGLVLLGDPNAQLGLTRDLAAVLRDPRDPKRIDFTLHDLLKQHVLQIASGYEDANDAKAIRLHLPDGLAQELKSANEDFLLDVIERGFEVHEN